MSTGDLKNNIKKLQSQIKAIKYTGKLDIDGIKDGSPTAFLPLYHYVFTSYSNKLNRDISNSNNELYGKSDLRFVEAVYKILRDMFSYKPPVTREQFFLAGFAERKVIMATEIVRHVHSVYSPPSTGSSYKLASKLEKKQHEIQTKVQGNIQNDNKTQTKARKVAGRSADLTEAIVLPRYVATPRDWREPQTATSSVFTNSPHVSSGVDDRSHQSSSPINNSDTEGADMMTKQVTEHITNVLTTLNNQVGKISNALQKVEDKLETQSSPRVIHTPDPPSVPDSRPMETLLSKVILLENRMTILENKVEDIQSFCEILLENRNNNSDKISDTNKQDVIAISTMNERDANVGPNGKMDTNTMHPSFVNAFTPVVGSSVDAGNDHNGLSGKNQGKHKSGRDNDGSDADDDITIEDVVARDFDHAQERLHGKTADMHFMKTLIGPNDSEISLTTADQDTSGLVQELQTKNKPESRTIGEDRHNLGNMFSPICGHIDPFLRHFDDGHIIQVPCVGTEEDFDSRRLSSTPSKPDLDSSTINRVHRIMQMMQDTQNQFNIQD